MELIDFKILQGFRSVSQLSLSKRKNYQHSYLDRSGLRNLKNITKFLLIPAYQDEVAEINSEIVEGVTKEMTQLTSLYLGVTNEWLEAMAMTSGANKVSKMIRESTRSNGFMIFRLAEKRNAFR